MKIWKALSIALGPATLMIFGWVLGQYHRSGEDLAGILLFVTGGAGLVLALGLRWLTRRHPWHSTWYWNLLLGIGGCGLAFVLVVLYTRWFK